jgi:hypothetical protein
MTDHPIDKHEEQLRRLGADVDDHACRIGALEKVSAAREEQVKNLYQSIGRIEAICDDIRKQVASMIDKTETELMDAISKLADRVAALERSDGDKWKSAVGYVLSAAIGAIIIWLVDSMRRGGTQ